MFRIEFMQRALTLAKRGLGHVSPNPMVGCVIAKKGRIIGEGYHQCFGSSHAEINAIENATEPVAGADVYVTLEPCSHHGKTPPCADRLIQEKVKRVFVAMEDPNPLVNGQGIRRLKEAGIEVSIGHLEAEARELNRFFVHHTVTGRPYVVLKAAITLDGFIADREGKSKWISNSQSRMEVHRLRRQMDAVLVGAGTVRADNPKLSVRMVQGRDPVKIILSNSGDLQPESTVFKKGAILVTAPDALTDEKKRLFENIGVKVMENDGSELAPLLKSFATMGLASLLLEGGAGIFGAFLEQELVDEFRIYVAPVIVGDGISLFRIQNRAMADAIRLSGEDTRICLREL